MSIGFVPGVSVTELSQKDTSDPKAIINTPGGSQVAIIMASLLGLVAIFAGTMLAIHYHKKRRTLKQTRLEEQERIREAQNAAPAPEATPNPQLFDPADPSASTDEPRGRKRLSELLGVRPEGYERLSGEGPRRRFSWETEPSNGILRTDEAGPSNSSSDAAIFEDIPLQDLQPVVNTSSVPASPGSKKDEKGANYTHGVPVVLPELKPGAHFKGPMDLLREESQRQSRAELGLPEPAPVVPEAELKKNSHSLRGMLRFKASKSSH